MSFFRFKTPPASQKKPFPFKKPKFETGLFHPRELGLQRDNPTSQRSETTLAGFRDPENPYAQTLVNCDVPGKELQGVPDTHVSNQGV